MLITRSDRSAIALWWWTIDRVLLSSFFILVIFGIFLVMASSQHLAESLNISSHHFTLRHILFGLLSFPVIILFSVLNERQTKIICIVGLLISLCLLLFILFDGSKIKGAQRWVHFLGFSFQPSEVCKPFYVIVNAWLLSLWIEKKEFPGWLWSIGSLMMVSILLLLQPDVGMTIVVSVVWGTQFFVAGLPLVFVALIALTFMGAGVGAYFTFDHVQLRVDRFFGPDSEIGYQAARAIEAFQHGGILGRGPGEGRVKEVLPDAHADFIFAVTGEEFGLLACLVIVGLFAFVVLRGFARVMKLDDLFVLLAVAGLLSQFAVQALINMASSVSLIPPKGMTLPFISYGGSSTLALAIGMGMVLALTRERPETGGARYEH